MKTQPFLLSLPSLHQYDKALQTLLSLIEPQNPYESRLLRVCETSRRFVSSSSGDQVWPALRRSGAAESIHLSGPHCLVSGAPGPLSSYGQCQCQW